MNAWIRHLGDCVWNHKDRPDHIARQAQWQWQSVSQLATSAHVHHCAAMCSALSHTHEPPKKIGHESKELFIFASEQFLILLKKEHFCLLFEDDHELYCLAFFHSSTCWLACLLACKHAKLNKEILKDCTIIWNNFLKNCKVTKWVLLQWVGVCLRGCILLAWFKIYWLIIIFRWVIIYKFKENLFPYIDLYVSPVVVVVNRRGIELYRVR